VLQQYGGGFVSCWQTQVESKSPGRCAKRPSIRPVQRSGILGAAASAWHDDVMQDLFPLCVAWPAIMHDSSTVSESAATGF
jgi:hypothetical protein